jgi:hypothetical protein
MRSRWFAFAMASLVAPGATAGPGFAQQPHNVILFVADGLR